MIWVLKLLLDPKIWRYDDASFKHDLRRRNNSNPGPIQRYTSPSLHLKLKVSHAIFSALLLLSPLPSNAQNSKAWWNLLINNEWIQVIRFFGGAWWWCKVQALRCLTIVVTHRYHIRCAQSLSHVQTWSSQLPETPQSVNGDWYLWILESMTAHYLHMALP